MHRLLPLLWEWVSYGRKSLREKAKFTLVHGLVCVLVLPAIL
jgi:hypothetical protein